MEASFNPQNRPFSKNTAPQVYKGETGFQKRLGEVSLAPNLDLQSSNPGEIKPERKTSMPVAIGSLIGTLLPMILLASRQGKFKDAKGLSKVLAPFMVDYGVKEIIGLGGSAVLGGLLGGVIHDKGEDTWAKVKEGNYQFITNITMPVLFCEFYKRMVKKLGKQFPKVGFLSSEKMLTKITRSTLVGLIGVVSGVTTGAFLSNQLNKRIHKDEIPPRKIHAKDFLIQVDDMIAGFTVTGALENVAILCHLDKVLPLVYFLSGLETGNEK
jgi:hypothetical protein